MLRFLLFLFLASSAYAAFSSAPQKVSVQLLWLDQFEFAGFYIAKEKGFYKEAGLDVEIKPFRKGINIPRNVAEGKTTYAIGYSSIIVDRGAGIPIVAMGALFQSSPLAIAVKKSSGIKTVNDLKNKKVMMGNDEINDASIMAMLTSRGLKKSDFTILDHTYDINDLINGKTDAMVVYTTNEPFRLREKGVDTTILDPKDYGFDFYADILYTSENEIKNHPERAKAFYEATMRGWQYAFEHIDETVELIADKYNTQHKSKAALTYEAQELKKLSALETNDFGKLNTHKLEGIDNIYHLMGTIYTKIDMDRFLWSMGTAGEPAIALSEEEKRYLQTKKKVTMCVDPDWMPFEAIQNGRHTGLAADYMSHFSNAIHLPIELVPTQDWSESLVFAQQRKCDIFSLAMETPTRKQYMNFTQPYLTSSAVFATRMDQSFIPEFKEIISEKIGITRGDGLIEALRKEYPGIHLVEVDSIHQGLEKVASGELFAFVDTLSVISYGIAENFSDQLKIGGKLDQTRELRVGVRNDDPVLLHLFEKAIGTLTDEKKNEIKGRWISVKYEKGVDYDLLIKISSLLLIVVVILIVWNRKLKRLNKTIEQLSIIDELSGLYNRRYFNTKFMQILASTIKNRRYFFFILLDIDNFKKYNDGYGHLKGDEVISKIGQTLISLFNRDSDIAFRLGGEEFGCFGSSDSMEGILQKAEEIRQEIQALAIEHRDNPPYATVTVSGGVVILSSDAPAETQEMIYHRADQALYLAKEAGRNCIIQAP